MTLKERLPHICNAAAPFSEYLGLVTEANLAEWVSLELGSIHALDEFVPYGPIHSKAIPIDPILAIISRNAAHSGLQTVLRSLVLGATTRIKLPSSGLPEVENILRKLPEELSSLFEVRSTIPDEWWTSPQAVAFGNNETLADIHSRLSPQQRFIAHGHKLSIGIVYEAGQEAATLAAKDIALFDQHGCLSAINIYVDGEKEYLKFAEKIHTELASYEEHSPRAQISLSESGAISNLRETVRFQAANDSNWSLYESTGSTAHTVIASPEKEITGTPLNRCVMIKPLPTTLNTLALGAEQSYLSSIGVYPFNKTTTASVAALGASRICALGKLQEPNLCWHHDGYPTLVSLIKWQDIG